MIFQFSGGSSFWRLLALGRCCDSRCLLTWKCFAFISIYFHILSMCYFFCAKSKLERKSTYSICIPGRFLNIFCWNNPRDICANDSFRIKSDTFASWRLYNWHVPKHCKRSLCAFGIPNNCSGMRTLQNDLEIQVKYRKLTRTTKQAR